MTEAFVGTAILTLVLTGFMAMVVGMAYDAEMPRLRWVATGLAVFTAVASVACWLAAIWWEVLAR